MMTRSWLVRARQSSETACLPVEADTAAQLHTQADACVTIANSRWSTSSREGSQSPTEGDTSLSAGEGAPELFKPCGAAALMDSEAWSWLFPLDEDAWNAGPASSQCTAAAAAAPPVAAATAVCSGAAGVNLRCEQD